MIINSNSNQNTKIDWHQIDTIFLDMDGTLLDLNYDLDFWLNRMPMAYASKHNISFHKAKEKVIPILTAEQGKLHWYSLDYWQEVFEMDIIALKHETAHLIQEQNDALSFLKHTKTQSKKLFLITNAHRKTLKLKMQYLDLLPFFDGVVSSHDFGYAKETPEFWQHLEQKLTFDKDKTLFCDDSESVLKSAKNYGIKHIVAMSKPSSNQEKQEIPGLCNIQSFNEII